MTAVRRPVLRYHGGKWRLAPWIISHFPAHRVYVEPFGGGGSVLMRKRRAYSEVYNDLDEEVVNVFRVIRDPGTAASLARMVELTPYARAEFVEAYEPAEDPVERARRTIFRAAAGFGAVGASGRLTGFRAHATRSGTTPAHDWSRYADLIQAFTERLRGVVIEARPAQKVMAAHDGPGTLHYLDPPYPHSTRTPTAKWDRIYRHEMTDDDHRGLAEFVRGLEGAVVVSGYACDLYDKELFPDWRRVARATHGSGDAGSVRRVECLWISPSAERPSLELGL